MARMFAFGITRLDAGAEGIHLAWNAPDVVCLSSPGFDIQRRQWLRGAKTSCATLDAKAIAQIRGQHELQTPIGTMLYRQSGPLPPLDPGASAQPWPSGNTPLVDLFTVELSSPTNSVRVGATTPATVPQANTVFAVALSGGKGVAAAFGSGDGGAFTLTGSGIDQVLVYVVGTLSLFVCVLPPSDPNDANWTSVPYLVKGLTLPIREADPTLTSTAAELTAAQSRLVTGESFSPDDFKNLTPALRMAVSASALGRPGERVLSMRTTPDEPFEELSFSDQLALLQLHPRLRRVLGFGYFDHQSSGLQNGQIYEYRITGHFNPADLGDTVYDVHTIPSQTVLPATLRIGSLGLTFPRPASLVLDPGPGNGALLAVSRRGILLDGQGPDAGWIGPSLEGYSLITDLPAAASTVVLETSVTHSFRFAGGDPWLFTAPDTAAPPSPRVVLHFASPVTQIRLRGKGILFAVRIPGAPPLGAAVADTAPIVFAAQPLPAQPLSLTVSNLQNPPNSLTTASALHRGPRRPLPGFDLAWLPAPSQNVGVWPSGTTGAPPIESMAFQIEHRDVTLPSTFGEWEPILPGDNLSFGTRDNVDPPVGLAFGSDLGELYPVRRPRAIGAGNTFHLSDIFQVNDSSETFTRPMPAFGTVHQYRIRAMDTVGRVSSDWTVSEPIRLEKHIPPPLPVGPQPEPAMVKQPDGTTALSRVPGAKARALVAGDSSLRPADLAILGSHQNAIILDWGWRDSERVLDPLTSEFRIYYLLNPADVVPGTITSVTASPGGGWDLAFESNRTLNQNECTGQWITAGGYPFRIATNTQGSSVTLHVESALVNPAAAPVVGPVQFGRPLLPGHQRPPAWDQRVAIVPLTIAATYRYVLYDLLNLSVHHPLDSIWVGVSAADAESYIADELPSTSANGNRPGNESSIATCAVAARDHSRPVFSIPPPLGDVPEIVGEEPAGREILVSLDLSALLPSALPAGEPMALDRCPADSIFAITSLNAANQVTLLRKDGSLEVVTFPNPGDEAAVVGFLQGSNPEQMPTRYILFLAANHSQPSEIFERISADILAFGVVQDRLAPKPARFFYRVRRADALGRVSEGGAIVPVVVRVPSTSPPAAPVRVALTSSPTAVSISLRVPDDPDLSHLLLFATTLPFSTPIGDLSGAELLRTPNRRDLYPQNGIRLRTPGGALLPPVVKSLSDPDVGHDGAGNLTAAINIPATFGTWVVLWAFTLSKDGIPSRMAEPFTTGATKA